MRNIISKYKNYINSLDIYINSHGGVATNYLSDFLYSSGFNVNCKNNNLPMYRRTCHLSECLDDKTPTIHIHGDYVNAIISMHKRNFLKGNAFKIHYSLSQEFALEAFRDNVHQFSLDHFLKKFPDDPIGFKKMKNNFSGLDNVFFLKYPYSLADLQSAFNFLNIDIDLNNFKIKQRSSDYRKRISSNQAKLQKCIAKYNTI